MSNTQSALSALADTIQDLRGAVNDVLHIGYLLRDTQPYVTDVGVRRWLDEQKEWDDEPDEQGAADHSG